MNLISPEDFTEPKSANLKNDAVEGEAYEGKEKVRIDFRSIPNG